MAKFAGADAEERAARAFLAHALGRPRARRLLDTEGSALGGIARLALPPRAFDEFRADLERASLRLMIADDPEFPALLREIPDPPLALYVAGDPRALRGPVVAVVGARRCTRIGADSAEALAGDLAALGIVVVSGLALGIDTAAHRGAMANGRTAAVLGSGLSQVYPASNRLLACAILEGGGALVSEYPPGWGARNHQFPERNRLISGLALGVVIVEAGEQSGSLITARLALEQGRDVMAVPGSIANPVARGCHRLLRQGACLVTSAEDVLEALQIEAPAGSRPRSGAVSDPEPPAPLGALVGLLGEEVTTLDQLCAASGLAAETLSVRLVELELGGFVEQVPGGYIRRRSAGG